MVRLAASWSESLRWANLEQFDRDDLQVPVHSFEPYLLHETEKMTDSEYLGLLRDYLKVPSLEDALHAHLGFLGDAYPRTEQLVSDLHVAGHQTACLSNTDHWHWAKMTGGTYPAIRALQIKTASCLFNARKPNPAIFDAFEKFVGLHGRSVIYFDDTPMNVYAASQFGWEAYVIDANGDPVEQIRKVMELPQAPS